MTFQKIINYILRHSGDIGIAYLLAIVSADGLSDLPMILLAAKLNIAVIPLAVTGVIQLQWWVWYVISVLWALQILHHAGYSVTDVIESIAARARGARRRAAAVPGAAAGALSALLLT